MPVIKSAIKKLRKDRKRTAANDVFRKKLDAAIKAASKQKTAKAISHAFSLVDRAVKNKLVHKNRAAHIKASLSKLAKPQASSTTVAKAKKPAVKTAASTKKAVTKPVKKPTKAKK